MPPNSANTPFPFSMGDPDLHTCTQFLGTTRVHTSNSTLIGSAIFVINEHSETDTDHATSIAIGRICVLRASVSAHVDFDVG